MQVNPIIINRCSLIFLLLYLLNIYICSCVSIIKSNRISNVYKPQASYRYGRTIIASIPTDLSINKSIVILVYTFWGKESPFNSVITVDGCIKDTGLDIKERILKKTGIPIAIQALYVCDSPVTNDIPSATPLKDDQNLGAFIRKLKICDSTKELQFHLLLDLPAPVYNTNKLDVSKIGEYIAALSRHGELINNLQRNQAIPSRSYQDNINSFIKESQKIIPKDTITKSDTIESHFIKQNKRIYLVFYKDYPPSSNDIEQRISRAIRRQFPIDLPSSVKFSTICLLLRYTGDHDRIISNILLVAPVVMIAGQTRVGALLTKILFHMLPTSYVPEVFSNLLPAHVSEKLKVK